jgi:hypothetical protein
MAEPFKRPQRTPPPKRFGAAFATLLQAAARLGGREKDTGIRNPASAIPGTAHLQDGSGYVAAETLAGLYMTDEPPVAEVADAQLPEGSLGEELRLSPGLTVDALLRLRRRFALRNHPDRVAPSLRARATRRMKLANALIDAALERARQRE